VEKAPKYSDPIVGIGLDSVAAEALVQRPVLKGERLLPLAKLSDVDLLGDAQRIVEFNTKVSDRAVHLGVAKQELHRPQVAGLSVNQGSLCSPQRVRPVPARIEADRGHPVADETGVLPCRQVRRGVQPAWKEEPAARHGGRGDPLENGLSGVLGHFELDGSSGLALDDRYAVADGAAHHEVTDFEADEVTAAQLAVDRQIEEGQVAKIARDFESCTNGPNLSWQERAFLTDQTAPVPRRRGRPDRRKLDSGHGEVSIHPSHPKHRHRADAARLSSRTNDRSRFVGSDPRCCSAMDLFEPVLAVAPACRIQHEGR